MATELGRRYDTSSLPSKAGKNIVFIAEDHQCGHTTYSGDK
jgi:hypothetical protein